MFGDIGGYIGWNLLLGTTDEDWIDRINHLWTVAILGICAIIVTSGQYIIGSPIQCWTPVEFEDEFNKYTHSICWTSNTYYVPISDDIPDDISEKQDKEMTYYQWVPIILLFQALLFKSPNILWRLLNGYSGIKIEKMSVLTDDALMSSPEEREKKVEQMAKYINTWITSEKDYRQSFLTCLRQKLSCLLCFFIGKRDGKFLTGFYIFVKLLYCMNVIGQFFLLNAFMSMDYNNFGFEVIDYYMKHGEWKPSPRFPLETLCDFTIRQLKNHQRYTIQCVMPLNLLNEKIFMFEWFWFFLLTILTCCNLVSWVYYGSCGDNNIRYIKHHLRMCKEIQCQNDIILARIFVKKYLRDDGVFILRVLEKNAPSMITKDLVFHLWSLFREQQHEKVKMINHVENEYADIAMTV